jgi:hypothetical protein
MFFWARKQTVLKYSEIILNTLHENGVTSQSVLAKVILSDRDFNISQDNNQALLHKYVTDLLDHLEVRAPCDAVSNKGGVCTTEKGFHQTGHQFVDIWLIPNWVPRSLSEDSKWQLNDPERDDLISDFKARVAQLIEVLIN